MAASLYYKEADALVKVDFGESGAVAKVVSASRDSVLTAGTAFSVPEYEIGSGRLQVFLDGLLCLEGSAHQYTESTETSIIFNDDIPADMEIIVIVL